MKSKKNLKHLFSILSVCLILLGALGSTAAQDDCYPLQSFTNGGFEDTNGCTFASSACFVRAFNQGCVNGWGAANGSPDACWSFPQNPVAPFEGELMAAMGCSDGVQCRNEAIFTNVFLDPTKTYELSFAHRTATFSLVTEPVNVDVYLTTGQSNIVSSSLDPCSNISIPSGSVNIFSQSNFLSSSWLSVTVPFNPAQGMNQLLFVVTPVDGNNGTQYWLVDDVALEECDPCPDEVRADFELVIPSTSGGSYTISAVNYDTYSAINGQHQWYVLTSTSPNGPFTPAGIVNGPTFNYQAQDGIYYTIIHKVTTDCGEACYVQNICRNCPEGLSSCNMCGVVDCDIIDTWWPPCNDTAPTGLGCQYFGAQLQLTWDPIPGATCYIISFEPYNSTCCKPIIWWPPFSVSIPASQYPKVNVPSQASSCFRWRVRACCEEGFSPWSPYRCQSNKTNCPIVGKPGRGGDDAQQYVGPSINSISVFPNPSNEVFNIAMNFETPKTVHIRIMDSTGKLVYTSGEKMVDSGEFLEQWYPENRLTNGLYILEVNTDEQTIREKLILNR